MVEKGRICARNNLGKLNYIKIRVHNNIIKLLEDFIMDLGVHWHGLVKEDYIYHGSEDYESCGNDEFEIFMIYGEKYVHLIINTKLKEKLNKILLKHFEWVK